MSNFFEMVGREVVEGGIYAGAFAATAAIISSSVSAGGAAAFGACAFIAGRPVRWLCTKIFNTDKPTASFVSKIVSLTAAFFAGTAAAWGMTHLLGIKMTFTAAATLSGATLGLALAAAIIAALAYVAIFKSAVNSY